MSNSHHDDEILKTVGNGSTAKVHLINREGRILARKEISVSEENLNFYLNEVKILKIMRNRYVLNYYYVEYNKEENKLFIYTEYFQKGCLEEELENRMKNGNYIEKGVLFLY